MRFVSSFEPISISIYLSSSRWLLTLLLLALWSSWNACLRLKWTLVVRAACCLAGLSWAWRKVGMWSLLDLGDVGYRCACQAQLVSWETLQHRQHRFEMSIHLESCFSPSRIYWPSLCLQAKVLTCHSPDQRQQGQWTAANSQSSTLSIAVVSAAIEICIAPSMLSAIHRHILSWFNANLRLLSFSFESGTSPGVSGEWLRLL